LPCARSPLARALTNAPICRSSWVPCPAPLPLLLTPGCLPRVSFRRWVPLPLCRVCRFCRCLPRCLPQTERGSACAQVPLCGCRALLDSLLPGLLPFLPACRLDSHAERRLPDAACRAVTLNSRLPAAAVLLSRLPFCRLPACVFVCGILPAFTLLPAAPPAFCLPDCLPPASACLCQLLCLPAAASAGCRVLGYCLPLVTVLLPGF